MMDPKEIAPNLALTKSQKLIMETSGEGTFLHWQIEFWPIRTSPAFSLCFSIKLRSDSVMQVLPSADNITFGVYILFSFCFIFMDLVSIVEAG